MATAPQFIVADIPGVQSRKPMRRLLIQLLVLFSLFVISLLIQIVMPYRQAGPIYVLRLALFLISFIAAGAWLLFSLLGFPRALLAVYRTPSTRNRPALPAVALGVSSIPLLAALGIVCAWPGFRAVRMPGRSYQGSPPVLSPRQQALRDALHGHVDRLAGTIGDRNAITEYTNLAAAATYIETILSNAGYAVEHQRYVPAHSLIRGKPCDNLTIELPGTSKPDEIVVIGAHYDSVMDCPGANDNGSGTAALLELARAFAGRRGARTLRFVAFVNEEPPFFWTPEMGSAVYAARCRARNETIVAMVSLETIGCYTDAPRSQHYPTQILEWFYPTTGNFIGFIGNTAARDLVRGVVGSFRRHARFPSEGAVLPGAISGVEWSDNWSFSRQGYPAMMITDTAPFRYADYHTTNDVPARLNYDRFAYVVDRLEPVIAELVSPPDRR